MKRIPTLDGWRGVAILCVMVAHFQAGFLPGHRPFHDWQWLIIGGHGVDIFFVLSGYLITSRLFEEERIDLKRFYMRRFFRLMPTSWTYLAFLAALGLVLRAKLITAAEVISCLLFYRNYQMVHAPGQGGLTGHFWTLSIEEQFYLVWPAILGLVGRRARWLAVCGILFFGFSSWTWCYSALFVGCGLAFVVRETAFRAWIQKTHRWLFPLCLLGLVWHVTRYHNGLLPISESVLIALSLACTSLNPESLPSRFLESGILKTLGIYSYSFYVWQEFFLVTHTGLIGLMLLPFVAITSWKFIEQPGIRLGRRFQKRRELVRA